jgi:serine/threonine-protein kinase
VYALGLLLYRALTGRLPWPAGNTTQALRAHLFADPEPVPSLPGMPAAVADLCLRCLAKQPEERPGAAAVAEVLAALVGMQPIIPPVAAADLAPVRRPARAPGLRVRTSLRVARALRLGGAQPLGGGLFRADGLLHGLASGGRLSEAVLARRHRFQAGVATVILVASIGLAWSSTREPADVGTAQAAAAGAGPGAVVPHGTGCKVRYRVQRDSGADFGAQVTVINTGEHPLSAWSLEFAFTGGQRLTDAPKRLTQRGRKLVLRAKSDTELRPGRSASVMLSGSYRVSNPLPVAFTLNGRTCRAEVIGAVGAAATEAAIPGGTPATDVRKKPAPRKTSPAPSPSPSLSPAPPGPPADKQGFSVAV